MQRVAWLVLALVFVLAVTPFGHSQSNNSATNQTNKLTSTNGKKTHINADKDADWTKASSDRNKNVDRADKKANQPKTMKSNGDTQNSIIQNLK